jgi:proline iminopeptidase
VDVRLPDGYRLFVEDLGSGLPLVVLHGGPGLDHTMFRPYLDPLADEFRLLYVDQRGQGRSERVDAATLTLERFARDIDLLGEALRLDRLAVLGHSFGAIVATWHAIEVGSATAYVISGGGDSSAGLEQDVQESLQAMGEAGARIAESWAAEETVETEDEFVELMEVQTPFHFAGPPPADVWADMVYTPGVLRHFAQVGYGDFDFTPNLGRVTRPTLVIVGEEDRTTTLRASQVLHQGIDAGELVVMDGVGHMSFIEAPDSYLGAVRNFLRARAA